MGGLGRSYHEGRLCMYVFILSFIVPLLLFVKNPAMHEESMTRENVIFVNFCIEIMMSFTMLGLCKGSVLPNVKVYGT